MKQWLVVNLLIPTEFEEPVANFVMEQGATGIEEGDEEGKWKKLKTYLPRDGNEGHVLPALRRYLQSLRRLHPESFHFELESLTIPDQDWGENWKRFFKPVQVTSRIVVKPPWHPVRRKKGQIAIDIVPGLAFGTGTHATTKLCIRALEKRLRPTGDSVLDVGTGSGVLAIITAKLGAREVWGCETDGLSVQMARENMERNHVSDRVRIRKGTIGVIRKRFDAVVANIDFKVLKKMRWPLVRHLTRGGWLILSGILEGESEGLCRRYRETGRLHLAEITHEDEWACITFRKR
jgi:ribosomal protein L11 methyltransferase